ncbi:hypothetical protein JZ751_000836 [Albula glossodonta]|uniref:Uncharacterized protein n=1 Tax=Albula glossodonta TaxID=121402 RepID=A0A8T2PWU9_9TELE|nr:hypothetical protein JZ751_000836 [Albula glossodonta]
MAPPLNPGPRPAVLRTERQGHPRRGGAGSQRQARSVFIRNLQVIIGCRREMGQGYNQHLFSCATLWLVMWEIIHVSKASVNAICKFCRDHFMGTDEVR